MTAGAGTSWRPSPRLAAVAIAAAAAGIYLLLAPKSADLAAQVYRAGLFRREGFALWDGQWYGGHHVPGYSVLFPPVAAALGPQLAAALAAVAAAALFERLVALGSYARGAAAAGAGWFALATVTPLLSGRLAFAFGLPFALGSLLALRAGRPLSAAALGTFTALASPVDGLFLALSAAAIGLVEVPLRRRAVVVALAALAPIAVLAWAFPEGGDEPFAFSAFWPAALAGVVAAGALGRRHRTLRAGAALYAAMVVGAFAATTPVGSNAVRLGPLVAGPLAALVLFRRRRLLFAVALPLLAWQWSAAVRDVQRAAGDPSTRASYYEPLLRFLQSRPGPPGRVEIPFTRNHWEAARVAPHVPLARGWERQLDRRYDALFYRPLSVPAYRAWLSALAVRWVALPDAQLDYSAAGEAALLRHGLPGLRPVWHDAHWHVWEVTPAPALLSGPARVTALTSDSIAFAVSAPGRIVVQARFTPYWAVGTGSGCVREAPRGWTAVDARRRGPLRLVTRFAIGRIRAHGPRCG
ncbi:MAG: hypothetical protein QOK31_1588 [Solirubrobacteraceae bacterium]|nr:hypothetical protein [Solirubrobacteraceae bacterium]